MQPFAGNAPTMQAGDRLTTRHATLGHVLRRRSSEHPERTAYVHLADGETAGPSLTYRQLDRRARAIAASLQRYGSAGDRTLLLFPSGLDFVSALFGCFYA